MHRILEHLAHGLGGLMAGQQPARRSEAGDVDTVLAAALAMLVVLMMVAYVSLVSGLWVL
jgi:hypothetical protein